MGDASGQDAQALQFLGVQQMLFQLDQFVGALRDPFLKIVIELLERILQHEVVEPRDNQIGYAIKERFERLQLLFGTVVGKYQNGRLVVGHVPADAKRVEPTDKGARV